MRLPGNRVTLNTDVQDQHGLPVPNVHFDDHANDVAMRSYAYDVADQLYGAVGGSASTTRRRTRRRTTWAPAG